MLRQDINILGSKGCLLGARVAYLERYYREIADNNNWRD
jgi:hypothetical protein